MMRRRTAVLSALATGALVLFAAGRTWVVATGLSGGLAAEATTSGAAAAPVVPAMALVVMAGALALTTARRIGAVAAGILMGLAGLLGAGAAAAAALDPLRTAAAAVSDATGTTAAAQSYTVTAWPWVAVVGGVLAALCGVAAALSGRGWSTARRYEKAAAAGGTGSGPEAPRAGASRRSEAERRRVDQMDAWDELSRGNDPT